MTDRYTKISESRKLQYAAGSPLVLCASALLSDNLYKSLILQLKLQNIEEYVISSLKISVDGYDSFNTVLFKDYEYQYLDLSAEKGDEFGTSSPIVLPDNEVRNYQIKVLSIGYSDGEVKNFETDFEMLPETEEIIKVLSPEEAVRYRYIFGNDKKTVPLKFKDIWMCGCGTINKNSESVCRSCGKSFDELKESLDETHLIYVTAAKLAENESAEAYKEAAELLKKIPDYKDASELCKQYTEKSETIHKDSGYPMEEDNAPRDTIDGDTLANSEAESIKEGKDAVERIEKNNQQIAAVQVEKEEKEKSKKKSAKKSKLLILFVLAAVVLIVPYMTFAKQYIDYGTGVIRLNSGKYLEAIQLFEKVIGYKDADQKLLEAKYGYVNNNRDSCQQPMYYEYLCELVNIDYKNAQSIYDEVYAWNIEIIAINDDGSHENMTTVSKYGKIHFVIRASGGVPNETIGIRIESGLPGVNDGQEFSTMQNGDVIDYSIWYTSDSSPSNGIAWIEIYDIDGNFLTEGSIYID